MTSLRGPNSRATVVVRWLLWIAGAALVLFIAHEVRWEDVEETTPAKGAAALPFYSLKEVAAAAGATLVERSALEPMPPPDATLFLETRFWDLFPERDETLHRWVESGGHLVVLTSGVPAGHLRWVPHTFVHHARAIRAASDVLADDDDDNADDTDARARRNVLARTRRRLEQDAAPTCETFVESPTSRPAFEPGRSYRRCLAPVARAACVDRHAQRDPRAAPTWELGNDDRTYALRVPLGRGDVTAIADCLPFANDSVLTGDHALIDAAVLRLQPGAQVWLVDDAEGESLPVWLWHNARAPLLLTLAAIGLALWRLMVRFGPREAVPAAARRSMGEQVRGTGQFIVDTDPQALHSATRQAFEDAARARVEDWANLDDDVRAEAVVALLGAAAPSDARALRAALSSAPRAQPAQWLEAIDLLEQARRALQRTSATPGPRA